MSEQWMPAAGWEGFYEVSNLGRVRSLLRQWEGCMGIRDYGGCTLKPIKTSRGYQVVNLTFPGGRRQRPVHRLVLETFLGPAPEGMEACHNNGRAADNRLENLRWDTPKRNHADKRLHGTWQVGERSPTFKLTEEQVRRIRAERMTPAAIRYHFGISPSQAKRLANGIAWPHIHA